MDFRFRGNYGLVHTVGNDGIGRIRLSDIITIISAHSASAYAVRFPAASFPALRIPHAAKDFGFRVWEAIVYILGNRTIPSPRERGSEPAP